MTAAERRLRRLLDDLAPVEPPAPPPVAPPVRPAVPDGPRCRRCGTALDLDPRGAFEPSIDALNVSQGVFICQFCVRARLRGGPA